MRTIGLTKVYGTTQALTGIDLDIPAGAVYGLVGPNGSGKTTAFEILAGLRRPSAGRVDSDVPQEYVAYCPDVAEFEPWLTAREVLEVSAGLVGRPQPRSEIDAMLECVGLANAADRRVGGFSRGMRSRLGLAAGLITGPRLLIADEPVAALDPAGRWEIIELLDKLRDSVTVVVSSHDLADVERLCDHIGVLVRGHLAYQGSLRDLQARAAPAWSVVVRPPAQPLLLALQNARWVRAAQEQTPGKLRVDITDMALAEAELPGILAGCGARLVEVRRAGISLQDIFFELTATGPHLHSEQETP